MRNCIRVRTLSVWQFTHLWTHNVVSLLGGRTVSFTTLGDTAGPRDERDVRVSVLPSSTARNGPI